MGGTPHGATIGHVPRRIILPRNNTRAKRCGVTARPAHTRGTVELSRLEAVGVHQPLRSLPQLPSLFSVSRTGISYEPSLKGGGRQAQTQGVTSRSMGLQHVDSQRGRGRTGDPPSLVDGATQSVPVVSQRGLRHLRFGRDFQRWAQVFTPKSCSTVRLFLSRITSTRAPQKATVRLRSQETLNGVDGDRVDQHGVVIGVEIDHGGVAGLRGEALGVLRRYHQPAVRREGVFARTSKTGQWIRRHSP